MDYFLGRELTVPNLNLVEHLVPMKQKEGLCIANVFDTCMNTEVMI